MQKLVRRIVNELQARGFRTWFGARSLRSLADSVPRSSIVPPCFMLTSLRPPAQTWTG